MPNDRMGPRYWAFEDSLGYLARLVFRSFSMLREQRTREHGISAGQWAFLRQLWHEDGISQRELSGRLAMRDSTTAVTLRGMERAALVQRRVNCCDRREILVFLTPYARSLESILLPVTADVQSHATRNFSDEEVEALRGLLIRVIDNLSREDQDARSHSRPPKS